MPRRFFLNCVLFLSCPLTCLAAPSPELPHPLVNSPDLVRPAILITQEKLDETLHRLTGDDVAAFVGFTPQLVVAEQFIPNAYARGDNSIVLTRGLLETLASDDELAFVLAHELGHLMLHHRTMVSHRLLGTDSPAEPIKRELEADRFALELLTRSGYAADAAPSFLQRLGAWGQELGSPLRDFHPSINARIDQLESGASRANP